MEGYILNKNFVAQSFVVDIYDSFIWTDRYNTFGDFEIHTSLVKNTLNSCNIGYYLRIRESDHVMIIEDIEITTDPEEGNKLLFSGRSLESILDRRIVWQQTLLEGKLQTQIERLLNENIIKPSDPKRKISNFIFVPSTDPAITDLTLKCQITGSNLLVAIGAICEAHGLGFKIRLTDDNKFAFELYSGVDRSFRQTTVPYVIFAPQFDSIVNSSFRQTDRSLKTVTLVAGEGEGLDRRTFAVYSDDTAEGLDRREMYTDARDISSEVYTSSEEPTKLTDVEYNELLKTRGLEKLAETIFVETFDGQIEQGATFIYGKDFSMGDIIQVVNDYGMESVSRVIELIRSSDPSEESIYPTFSSLDAGTPDRTRFGYSYIKENSLTTHLVANENSGKFVTDDTIWIVENT